jgi:hypothetical protein
MARIVRGNLVNAGSMHTIEVLAGGFLLLGVFLVFGRWIGGG